ncbi:MAG: 30S ribosomal protein S17 [Desulfobacterales bacterium]|jgi:small subunit ribosomal protein S17|nr:30S ribosomal protein S17 [Desulfobacter sp.]MDP6394286.1 30S ribosomal protein S17 [Desulfobacterales bacterium]MDP6682313.1 30S ribosomal protein S17 [Desulfobacterales bacterium]MDP6807639.1 30S ribosomal protein S17 [Desulfobacterales bacterium]HJO62256.1 30S ribosomal protein S17 [Desulfobacterales bacterium]|tara:strand:+ start:4942 stop:5199 length:258 start_codon:yes stop_codon:yes gene_type:complete
MNKSDMRREVIGTIVSDRMEKTVIVQVERLVKHQLYKKYIRRRSKYTAHDEANACRIGDRVLIAESRPISKTKKWRVRAIVEKAI